MNINGYEICPCANLSDANLSGADLHGAKLYDANLSDANLSDANLCGANLSDANLHGANLHDAYLSDADLHGANLSDADMRYADLSDADLHGADLSGANLYDADLSDANLCGAVLPDYHVLPDTGHVTVYKKVHGGAVLTLFVPHDAGRTSCLRSRKCRVARARVVGSDVPGDAWPNLCNGEAKTVQYRLGDWVEPDDYNDDIREECTHGVHVFATYAEAKAY